MIRTRRSNLRSKSQRGSSKAVTHDRLVRRGCNAAHQALFDEVRALYEGGNTVREIFRTLGLGGRRVESWVRRIDLPGVNAME
jgi:hypothetical protein